MKPLALALLVLAPLASAAQDSTRTAASPSWLERVAAEIAPRPMHWRPLRPRLQAYGIILREGRRVEARFAPLLDVPPQVRRSRDEEE